MVCRRAGRSTLKRGEQLADLGGIAGVLRALLKADVATRAHDERPAELADVAHRPALHHPGAPRVAHTGGDRLRPDEIGDGADLQAQRLVAHAPLVGEDPLARRVLVREPARLARLALAD